MGTDATDLPLDDDLDWDELYALHAPALKRFIGELAPAGDIEDVLQKTFVRLDHRRFRHTPSPRATTAPALRLRARLNELSRPRNEAPRNSCASEQR